MSTEDGKLVLQKIIESGMFDEIRHKVVDELKKDDSLRKAVQHAVDTSKTLATADVHRTTKKALLEALRKELETGLLEKASSVAWGIMTDEQYEVKALLEEKVREALITIHQQQLQSKAPLPGTHPNMTFPCQQAPTPYGAPSAKMYGSTGSLPGNQF